MKSVVCRQCQLRMMIIFTFQSFVAITNVQVMCGCYAYEGFTTINLSQTNAFSDRKKRICLFFQFCNTFVQEAAYALWLEDQRKALYERTALHLEALSQKCRSCGGNGFIPGHGRGISISEQLKNGTGRRFSGMYCVSHRILNTQKNYVLNVKEVKP